MGGTSRMSREAHVRSCEGLGVRFPGATRQSLLKREASNSTGRNNGESVSPEIGNIGSAEPLGFRRRQVRVAKELDICSDGSPGT